MSKELNSWGSFIDAYSPFTEGEGYTAYKESLPNGIFPVDESDWRQNAFKEDIKGKYDAYVQQGGQLDFDQYTSGTTTSPLNSVGSNDSFMQKNVNIDALKKANASSVANGGGVVDLGTFQNQIAANGGVVPALPSTPSAIVKTETVPKVETDPLDTGTNQPDSYNELTGAMTNGNGEDITPTDDDKNQAKGIFDKASGLFGDIFSASDLRRMTLYTVGGLMTGGSLGGSFKWAGMRVMEEQQLNKKNNAVVSAAKIKASKDHGKRTGNNSFGINVEGIDGLTHIESYEIGSPGGDINVVDVPDSSNPGQTKRMTVDNFRNWVKSKGGSSAKGSNEKNMPSTKAARVYQVTGELSGIMDEVFANNEGMTSVSGKESVASYFSNRNYDLSSESELVNLKHITALGAEEAAANFRGNGKQIQDMAPYFDKSALSVEAGVPGDGVWGMMTDPFLSDPTPINGVTMDPKKIAVLVSTMKGMAGESGFEGVKKNFKILHKEYMTLKADNKIPAMELNPGENEFYTWVTKELKKPL